MRNLFSRDHTGRSFRRGKVFVGIAGASLLLSATAFAQNVPHLVVVGPSGAVAPDSSIHVSAKVEQATGVPLYQFWLNHRLLRNYSRQNDLILSGLNAGTYQVVVHSLGLGQMERRDLNGYRSQTLTLHVGLPSLQVRGPARGIARDGRAFIRARVRNALGYPYYEFIVNGRVVHPYSHKNYLALRHLRPGTYTVMVRSLGPLQYQNQAFGSYREKTFELAVPSSRVISTLSQFKLTSVTPLKADGHSIENLAIDALSRGGQGVANVPVTVLSSDPAVVSVSPSSVTTNGGGVAVVQLMAGKEPGTATITAISGSVVASTVITTTPVSSAPTLSPLTVSGETGGTGASSSPAVTAVGKPLTFTTEFSSRSGQPKRDVVLTFSVSPANGQGALIGLSATANGKTIAPTAIGKGSEAFLVPTNSQGKATLTLSDSNAASVGVAVSAPYTNVTASSPLSVQWTAKK